LDRLRHLNVTIAGVSDWNFADLWETVAAARPAATALVHGGRRLAWAEWDRRADGVAAAMLAAGIGRQAKVAQYLYNGVEYLESVYAAFKAGAVPVNTNYRYTADELVYLWTNADAEVVVFDADFTARVEAVRADVPGVRLWLQVGDAPCPPWAVPYETVAAAGAPGPVAGPWGRSGDDMLFIYTGGTTGMPKGVMWRQDDLFVTLNARASLRFDPDAGPAAVAARLAEPARHPPSRLLPGPPLMHGTGLFTAISVLDTGGRIVMPVGHRFDPVALLDTIEREGVTELSIVGDAFARPILAALDAEPDRWDVSSLWLILSSGVMWSAEVKAGLLAHLPKAMMVDTLGSSEAIAMASSRSSAAGTSGTAGFALGPDTRVIDDDGRDVVAGSGARGVVALRGRGPVGYYKDPEKSAATFRVIDGERWTVPGDYATVEADGVVRLLGRGSVVVNTGGEKVFPEEVEEVLKQHSSVVDAVVVGVPDERFGEVVVAVVEPAGAELDVAVLLGWVRERLAGYKVPRHVVEVGTIGRAANGKVDYRRLRTEAAAELGVELPAAR
jgi:acyl-CoA synthetase (AMP-forming)/AMP-acid ligase II